MRAACLRRLTLPSLLFVVVLAALQAQEAPPGTCQSGSAAGAGGACLARDGLEAEEASLLQRAKPDREDSHIGVRRGTEEGGKAPKKQYFLWISDFHMDPLYGKAPAGGKLGQDCWTEVSETSQNSYGTVGCDPPPSLVQSAMAAAKELIGSEAEFVVNTGDFSRHGMENLQDPSKDVVGIIGAVSGMIKAKFPTVPLLFGTLGNDDNPENYYTNITTNLPSNPWFSEVGRTFVGKKVMDPSAESTYRYGGYHAREMGGLRFLAIATVMYSHKHIPKDQNVEDDPFGQFAWLREELQKAADAGVKVWIVGHVPPGIETFGYSAMWQDKFLKQYLDIVQDEVLGSAIAAQLFGHVHKEEFRVLPKTPAGGGPILLSASVSPVYYNNPSFRLVEYSPWTGRLLTYRTYWAEMTTGSAPLSWKLGYDMATEYSTFKKLGLGVTAAPFQELAEKFLSGSSDYSEYSGWYATQLPSNLQKYIPDPGDNSIEAAYKRDRRQQYVCALTVLDQDGYEDCAKAALGETMDLKDIMRKIPKTWEDRVYHQVSYLLHWAARAHHSKLAHEVRDLAKKGRWKLILEIIHRLDRKHPEWHTEPDE